MHKNRNQRSKTYSITNHDNVLAFHWGLMKSAVGILTNTQSEITKALDHNPIANLTQEMGKECPDEQIYFNPTQNLPLERIRR